jgi:hypothetical protein
MKVFAVMSTARQVYGEMIFIRSHNAYAQASKADAEAKRLNEQEFKTPDNKLKLVEVSTPDGAAQCYCVAGAFELEVIE